MPFKITKIGRNRYRVSNKITGKPYGVTASKAKAIRMERAIEMHKRRK